MYTELVLKCRLKNKEELPEEVKEVLLYLFGENHPEMDQQKLPEHPFFKTPRWHMIGSCSSYSHVPYPYNYLNFDSGKLFSRSDLKNYDNEIELFSNWLMPYLDPEMNDFMGWIWSEGSPKPKFIHFSSCKKD